MKDFYVNYSCCNGSCPLIVEEQKYGCRISSCDDYCGSGFNGCHSCYFEESKYCNECIWKEGEREKKKNEATRSDLVINNNDNPGNC